MEEWQKEFFQSVEALASDVENFFSGLAIEVSNAAVQLTQASEEIAEQVQDAIASNHWLDWTTDLLGEPALNQRVELFLNEYALWFEAVIEDAIALYPDLDRDASALDSEDYWMRPPFSGMVQEPPACAGCRHYHGQVYGGNLLVCGMHPYGWEGAQCPDWQSRWE
jgi:hypothetical protein